MVKVLCKGGPYYWTPKPETKFEQRMRHWREGLLPKHGKDRFTRKEYLRAMREYPPSKWLPEGNIWPMTQAEEDAAWREFKITGPITLFRGAPHGVTTSAQTGTTAASRRPTSPSSAPPAPAQPPHLFWPLCAEP